MIGISKGARNPWEMQIPISMNVVERYRRTFQVVEDAQHRATSFSTTIRHIHLALHQSVDAKLIYIESMCI